MNTKDFLFKLYYQWFFLPFSHKIKNFKAFLLGRKKRVTIVFLVSELSMWRNQELYELLSNNSKISVCICLYPFSSFSTTEKTRCIESLKEFFVKKNVAYYDLTIHQKPASFLRKTVRPDIIFYPQPYYNLYNEGLSSEFFKDKLLCYSTYGINVINEPWIFNQKFNNFAWRLYYTSFDALLSARHFADNKGCNVRVVGFSLKPSYPFSTPSIWEKQNNPRKLIIWAPHYSIVKGYLENNSFLCLHSVMLEFADKFRDSLQFVFKPHPKLRTVLYEHPDWGAERTDEYYEQWQNKTNTQLETGDYWDLFHESDAMIHDSNSFTVEYLFTRKPVMFVTTDKKKVSMQLNQTGKAALDAHYIGTSIKDIELFLEKVVINGEDPMCNTRCEFYKKYLTPINGKSAAENIYEDLVQSLNLKK